MSRPTATDCPPSPAVPTPNIEHASILDVAAIADRQDRAFVVWSHWPRHALLLNGGVASAAAQPAPS